MRLIRLVIVSDTRLYREGLAQALAQSARFAIVGAVAGIADPLFHDHELAPDVILLDMGVAAAGEAVRFLKDASSAPVVALGLNDSEQEVLAAAEAGVSGFVLRDATLEELIACLVTVTQGELRVSPRLAGVLLRRVAALAAERPARGPNREITRREREIMALVEQGLSNKQIAARLSIEVTTVKNHIHNILERLGVRRRADAAAMLRTAPAGRRAAVLKI